jgi:hypothetical protein
VIDPTFTNVDVSFSFTTFPGYDSASVKPLAEDAVKTLLDPSQFGSPPGDSRGWSNIKVVYLWELVTALNNVQGVDRITALTVGANGGAQTATDLTLSGSIPLPRPGNIVGTPV